MKHTNKKMAGITLFFIVFQSLALTQCDTEKTTGSLQKSVFWKISGKQLNQPSYLFGSVHMMDSADFFIHKTIIEQLKRSDLLVLETNMDEPGYQEAALQQAMMKEDSLSGLLDEDTYRMINDFFMERYRVPLKALDKMKPFYVASMIPALSADKSTKSPEKEFMRIAHEENKSISGIATIDMEVEILNGISMEEQISYLLREIENTSEGKNVEKGKRMVEAYKKGNLEKIENMMMESMGNFPEIHTAMFVRRNQAWLPNMESMMKKESCFFVVGVGHLPGSTGLIRMLQERGYKVRPVHMDFWFHD